MSWTKDAPAALVKLPVAAMLLAVVIAVGRVHG